MQKPQDRPGFTPPGTGGGAGVTLAHVIGWALVVSLAVSFVLFQFVFAGQMVSRDDFDTNYAALQQWVQDTYAVPDLSDYALKSEIPTSPDLSNYALKSDLPSMPNLDGYVTEAEFYTMLDSWWLQQQGEPPVPPSECGECSDVVTCELSLQSNPTVTHDSGVTNLDVTFLATITNTCSQDLEELVFEFQPILYSSLPGLTFTDPENQSCAGTTKVTGWTLYPTYVVNPYAPVFRSAYQWHWMLSFSIEALDVEEEWITLHLEYVGDLEGSLFLADVTMECIGCKVTQ